MEKRVEIALLAQMLFGLMCVHLMGKWFYDHNKYLPYKTLLHNALLEYIHPFKLLTGSEILPGSSSQQLKITYDHSLMETS